MTPEKKTVPDTYYHAARPELLKFIQKNNIQVLISVVVVENLDI